MKKYVLALVKDKSKFQDRFDEVNLDDLNELKRISKVVTDLKDTLRANDDLVALSAPQLGHMDRVFCIKFANGDIRAFINPLVFANKGLHLSREVPIGFSTTEYIVPRSDEIHAAYQTPTGKKEVNAFKGVVSEVFQQMVNLLDGILLEDFGLEVLEGYDALDEDEKKKIISMYIDNLKMQSDYLEKVIKENPELKRMDDSIKFMTKLELGEIKTEQLSKEEKDYIKTKFGKEEKLDA